MMLLISFGSCKQDLQEVVPNSLPSSSDIYSVAEVQELFQQKKPLNWDTEKDAKFIYSVGMYTDSIFAVGYKPTSFHKIRDNMYSLDFTTKEWIDVEDKILDFISLNDDRKTSEIVIREIPLPVTIVKISSLSTINELKNMAEVRYIHPLTTTILDENTNATLRYDGGIKDTDPTSWVGCGCESDPIDMDDWTLTSPNVKRPWNYDLHNINDAAWAISTGIGIGVAVIDSGVSNHQENLDGDSGFFDPENSGRTETRINFLNKVLHPYTFEKVEVGGGPGLVTIDVPSTHDRCAHGTKSAGTIAAPRGNDGNAVGVAYNCNLYNIRAVHNVIINTQSEQTAVAVGLVYSADIDDIKIINMSIAMGVGNSSSLISDGIAYAATADKLMVCAAGSGKEILNDQFPVLFPANHPLTIAVTGIRTPPDGPLGNDTEACSICFSGEEVDFVVINQRTINENTTLSVGCDGDTPAYFSGSSSAAATFSGIAALVWEKQGASATSDQVLQKLITASSNDTPHPRFGWGWVDIVTALNL